ncbi:MAG: hypothetical protein Q7K65_00725 [Candidatus Buchananbacteria bacterium]|nr:hypothetical protein [Candidatus Buchananbacteria bacterium]
MSEPTISIKFGVLPGPIIDSLRITPKLTVGKLLLLLDESRTDKAIQDKLLGQRFDHRTKRGRIWKKTDFKRFTRTKELRVNGTLINENKSGFIPTNGDTVLFVSRIKVRRLRKKT